MGHGRTTDRPGKDDAPNPAATPLATPLSPSPAQPSRDAPRRHNRTGRCTRTYDSHMLLTPSPLLVSHEQQQRTSLLSSSPLRVALLTANECYCDCCCRRGGKAK